MNAASLFTGTRLWLRRTRCKWLLVMTVLCLALRENYPFSNFPMYSSFNNRTYYLYLTDARGNPIKTRQFGLSSSGLKKIFDRYRRLYPALKAWREAGAGPHPDASASEL